MSEEILHPFQRDDALSWRIIFQIVIHVINIHFKECHDHKGTPWYIYILYVHLNKLLNFTSSWDFVIFREYWISMDIKVKMQYLVQCTRTRVAPKNLSVMVRTGFALDQPSINGIGPINPSEKMKRSETVGNSRKRSERWSGQDLFNPHIFKNKHFPQRRFFFEGPKVSKGKRLETVGDRTFARQKRQVFTQFSNIFHEHMLQNKMFENCVKTCLFCRAKVRAPTVSNRFPLDTFGPSKKKTALREMLIFKNMRVEQVLAWSSFRPFPTVSDRFIFSEGLIGPIPFMEGWSSAKPVRTMTLKFFGATLVRVHCTKYCILTLISIDIQYSLKITKCQELVKFNKINK